MSMLVAFLFLVMGLLGVFHPSFFVKTELLSPSQIARNKRIWNRAGIAFIVLGLILLGIQFFGK